MQSKLFAAAILTFALAGAASASAISYQITIDTSGAMNTQGGIYLDFSPGSDVTEVDITGFSPSGGLVNDAGSGSCFAMTITSPCLDGGVAGTLDGNDLVFTNLSATNDYGELVNFGSSLSFEATFDAPLLGSDASEFDIELTGADLVTPILSDDPNANNSAIADFITDGNGNITPVTTADASITEIAAAPEPATGATLVICGALYALMAGLRKRAAQPGNRGTASVL